MGNKKYSSAVVIGAGISGLISARVLSNYCDQVTIIDRDNLPDTMTSRKGTPQGFHIHSLLEGGRRILEQFFPGFCDDLLKMDNTSINLTKDLKWFHHGVWKTQDPIPRTMRVQSRWHLEGLMRQKVKNIENIKWLQSAVTGLNIEDGKVQAVITKDGDYNAELVIDASGRGSPMVSWLKASGIDAPNTLTNKLGLKYASQLYKRESEPDNWKAMAVYPDAPKGNRSGVVFPVIHEDHGKCWLVSMIGRNGDDAGSSYEDFLSFAQKLDQPDIFEFIKDKEPLTQQPDHFSFPQSQWIRYDKMKKLPLGIIPIGDSIGFVNPIYGQGVSISLIEADILDKCLKQNLSIERTGIKYLKEATKFFQIPWTLISCEDWRYPQVKNRPPGVKLLNCYSRKLHRLSSIDKGIVQDVYDVLNFIKHPLVLYKPSTVFKVLFKRL